MTTRRLAVAVLSILALTASGCQKRHDIEVTNPCNDPVVLNLWETPDPRTPRGDKPERVVVPPLSSVTAEDALHDVDENGWSAEIVEGPGTGEVLRFNQGDRKMIVPGRLCSSSS